MPFTEGQLVPGGGARFANDAALFEGGVIQLVKPVWGPNGIINYVDDVPGLRFPVKAVLSDTSDAEVHTGDLALNAQRVTVVGGASITELGIDNAPYDLGVSGGVPLHLLYQQGSGTLATDGARAAARMSAQRILHVTGPPRSHQIPGTATLTTTAEITLLTAGATGVYHDLCFIGIYTDNIIAPTTACTKVLFRDATGGPIRYTIPIPEKGGSNVSFGAVRWNQTTASNVWTVALSAAMPTNGSPPVQSSVFVHAIAEVRRD